MRPALKAAPAAALARSWAACSPHWAAIARASSAVAGCAANAARPGKPISSAPAASAAHASVDVEEDEKDLGFLLLRMTDASLRGADAEEAGPRRERETAARASHEGPFCNLAARGSHASTASRGIAVIGDSPEGRRRNGPTALDSASSCVRLGVPYLRGTRARLVMAKRLTAMVPRAVGRSDHDLDA